VIEAPDGPLELSERTGAQCAIDVLQDDTGLIVAALIDERAPVGRAGVDVASCPVLDHEGMPGAARLLIEKIPARSAAEIAPVEFRRRIGDGVRDYRIVVAVEQIYFLPLDVIERIERAGRRLGFHLGDHRLQVGGRTCHARAGGVGDGQSITVDEIRGARLRAIERTARHHPHAPDDGRPGKPELNRHERAGRYARDGAVADRRVVRLQRRPFGPGDGARGRDGERDRERERDPRMGPRLREHGHPHGQLVPRST